MGLLRQSYITFHLYQINWLAFYGQLLPCTLFDTLMDNSETLPPYGKKIPHYLESFFLSFQTLTKLLGQHVLDAGQSWHRLVRRQWLSCFSLQEFQTGYPAGC